jgi:hypothetical protein
MRFLLLIVFLVAFLFSFVGSVVASINFEISNPQLADDISVQASISGISCDPKCYLQGVLTNPSPTRYFGSTQNNSGNWVEYSSNPSIEQIVNTFFAIEPIVGSWSGMLKIKFDQNNSNYRGPGEYLLKLRRFTGKSDSSAGESNILTVFLSKPTPTPIPTATPTEVITVNLTSTPSPIKTSTSSKLSSSQSSQTISILKTSESSSSQEVAEEESFDILGVSTESSVASSSSSATPEPTPIYYYFPPVIFTLALSFFLIRRFKGKITLCDH